MNLTTEYKKGKESGEKFSEERSQGNALVFVNNKIDACHCNDSSAAVYIYWLGFRDGVIKQGIDGKPL